MTVQDAGRQSVKMARVAMHGARTFYRATIRDAYFAFGMLDEKGNPSLTRMVSVVLVAAAVHGRIVDDKPLTTLDFTFAALACFATLGNKGMEMFRDWKQGKTE